MSDDAPFAILAPARKIAAVRLATYNIHGGVGVDGRYDPARVAAVLREIGADIVCLQEVALRPRGERHRRTAGPDGPFRADQASLLAEATGARVIVGSEVRNPRARFQNAILSRFPVLFRSAIDLTVEGCPPRSAIDADLAIGERVLRVIATHFGLKGAERHLQANRVLAALAAPLAPNRRPAATVLVMGDLNEWRGRRGGIRALERRLGRSFALRTFPSFMPVLALDRIYLDDGAFPALGPLDRRRGADGKPEGEPAVLEEVEVYRSPLARLASDHLPLLATLSWGEAAPLASRRRKGRAAALFAAASGAAALTALYHHSKRRATPTGW